MSLNGDWLTQINWIFKFFYAISEIYVAMSLAMSCEACDAEPWHKGVSGGRELSHGLLENVICEGVVLQGVVAHISFAFAPAGRCAALFFAEYFGEMARRHKA